MSTLSCWVVLAKIHSWIKVCIDVHDDDDVDDDDNIYIAPLGYSMHTTFYWPFFRVNLGKMVAA